MSAAHTSGPWAVLETKPDRDVDYIGETFIKASNGATLASLSNYNAIERRANASLMAATPKLLAALQSARRLLERCGPHLQGVEQECCGEYQPGYGGEYMGQREVVPVCCSQPIDLSDHVANEMGVIDAVIAEATGSAS